MTVHQTHVKVVTGNDPARFEAELNVEIDLIQRRTFFIAIDDITYAIHDRGSLHTFLAFVRYRVVPTERGVQ